MSHSSSSPPPDAAPAIASLVAQLATALRMTRPAGLTAGDAEGALPLPDSCCTGRRHGVRFLTVAPLPSAPEQLRAADLSTRRDGDVSSAARRSLAAASRRGAPRRRSTRAERRHCGRLAAATGHCCRPPQRASDQQQADGSQAACMKRSSSAGLPHAASVVQSDARSAAAADGGERHRPPRPEHVTGSIEPAEDGRDSAAAAAHPHEVWSTSQK